MGKKFDTCWVVGFGYEDVNEFFLWGWGWVWENKTCLCPVSLSSLLR